MTLPTSTWDATSRYFSGQGVVLLGFRDANGRPKGLVPIGNVCELTLGLEATVEEHKECQSGQRAIDLRLTTEQKATLSMQMENFISANLAIGLRATITEKEAGSVVDENIRVWPGRVEPLANIKVSLDVITDPDGTPTFTRFDSGSPSTPYDYKINTETGSIFWNDGSEVLFANLAAATVASSVALVSGTPGADTVLTFGAVPVTTEVDGYLMIQDTAGTAAATLNGKAHRIVSFTATTVTIATNTTGLTITAATGQATASGYTVEADYDFEAQNVVDAFTTGSLERYMRFEGLNTADENRPVVVEVWRFLSDPLAELALISDEVGNFVVEGSVLADPEQDTGSEFFKVTLVR